MTHNSAGSSVADHDDTGAPDSRSARPTPPARGVRDGWRNRTLARTGIESSLLGNLRASADARAQDPRWTTGTGCSGRT